MHERLRGTPSIALSSLLFAAMAVLARTTAGKLPSSELVFIRMFTGLVVLVGFYAVTGRRPHAPRPFLLFLRGAFGGVAVSLYFLAIDYLPVGPATLLNNMGPCWAALFAAWFLHERPSARVVLGLLVALGGAGAVIFTTSPVGQFNLGLGAAAGFLSAVLSGAALTTIRALRSDTDSFTVMFSFCLVSALISLPLAALDFRMPDASLWAVSIAVGLCSIGAQFLLTHGLAYVPAASGSAPTLLTTVFSWGMGALLLGEGAGMFALVGALLCIAGVVLASAGASARPMPNALALAPVAPAPTALPPGQDIRREP